MLWRQASEAGGERLMVGLTGYPNVGKSSTINALFGAKKTAVAATPGKTKHFQTLNVNERLTLCDCPGLVLPKYAASKAEMVAAGELHPSGLKFSVLPCTCTMQNHVGLVVNTPMSLIALSGISGDWLRL
jgi:ribosome biogenesis GTPase A